MPGTRRFLDNEILPMLAEAATEGLVEAQLGSSSTYAHATFMEGRYIMNNNVVDTCRQPRC